MRRDMQESPPSNKAAWLVGTISTAKFSLSISSAVAGKPAGTSTLSLTRIEFAAASSPDGTVNTLNVEKHDAADRREVARTVSLSSRLQSDLK